MKTWILTKAFFVKSFSCISLTIEPEGEAQPDPEALMYRNDKFEYICVFCFIFKNSSHSLLIGIEECIGLGLHKDNVDTEPLVEDGRYLCQCFHHEMLEGLWKSKYWVFWSLCIISFVFDTKDIFRQKIYIDSYKNEHFKDMHHSILLYTNMVDVSRYRENFPKENTSLHHPLNCMKTMVYKWYKESHFGMIRNENNNLKTIQQGLFCFWF